MTPNLYSIWLCLGKDDSAYVSQIIQNLSSEYKSQPFIPHLTLYGVIFITKDEGISLIKNVIKNEKPFSVKTASLESSSEFFKTLYIQMEQSPQLSKLQKKIMENLTTHIDYNFNPHISLIYANLTPEQKQWMKTHIQIQKEFHFSSLVLVNHGVHAEDIYKIQEWKVDYSQALE